MTTWILEDEPPALRRLTKLLGEARPNLHIAFTTDSIASCVTALRNLPHPALIFSDIHLADGLAFQVWEQNLYAGPIIFTTAYDQYALRAFRVNSVDYLLKPIAAEELEHSLKRVEGQTRPAASLPNWQQIAGLIQRKEPVFRERFLAQKGSDWLPVKVEELRQIYSKGGMTFALTTIGQRVLLAEPLDRIEEELNPREWFRINRAQIIHIDGIVKASAYFNHRLALNLKPTGELENLVSRQRVKSFRAWLGG